MRTTLIISGTSLLIGMLSCVADEPAVTKPVAKADTKTSSKSAEKTVVAQPAVEKRSPDEEAIRLTAQTYVKAYAAANAKSIANHFTPNGEYVDEQRNVFQGRKAIEDCMSTYFAKNPGSILEIKIDSIRFVSPDVAVEDGTTRITRAGDTTSTDTLYTAVHVKTDGKWLAASVRDDAPKNRRLHRSQLQQLEWMLGNWVHEGPDSIVHFSCESANKGNFLLRKFAIQIAGQEAMNGTQRIGWDPVTGKLRVWIFDSEGGYAEGTWHRDGDAWVLKSAGATADGQTASSTTIYRFINAHTMTWQSVDHEIAGVALPNSEVVMIVRQAPAPSPAIADDRK